MRAMIVMEENTSRNFMIWGFNLMLLRTTITFLTMKSPQWYLARHAGDYIEPDNIQENAQSFTLITSHCPTNFTPSATRVNPVQRMMSIFMVSQPQISSKQFHVTATSFAAVLHFTWGGLIVKTADWESKHIFHAAYLNFFPVNFGW